MVAAPACSLPAHACYRPCHPSLQFTIIARVLAVEEQNLMYLYRVDDGTGQLSVKYWISVSQRGCMHR